MSGGLSCPLLSTKTPADYPIFTPQLAETRLRAGHVAKLNCPAVPIKRRHGSENPKGSLLSRVPTFGPANGCIHPADFLLFLFRKVKIRLLQPPTPLAALFVVSLHR
jgi:hypothetical protein